MKQNVKLNAGGKPSTWLPPGWARRALRDPKSNAESQAQPAKPAKHKETIQQKNITLAQDPKQVLFPIRN